MSDPASSGSASSGDVPLSPERWDTVLRIFHDALDQPPEDRTAFVRDACGPDDALIRQVLLLLEADEVDDSLLRTDPGWAQRVTAAGSITGQEIGPYRIADEIGRGGMGVVYRAERDDLGTTVAVKVLRERFPSADRLRRFLAEQRVLGRLEHPGIARLLDAGATKDGTPFFVMEFVEGTPLTTYCEENGLSVDERIDLFLQVCEAVRYAHRNLVVHRDLKPSNVLVTDTADGPVVKLLDFGIAKLLADDPSGDAPLTRTGERLLTPAYAAPEQVDDRPISTSTDVYALGALLYEALTGRRPVEVTDLPLPEAVQRILHDAPPPPSEAAATRASGRKRLPGDLDTICLTALRKDPARRYASVEALHDDLRRFLTDRPISARPDTATYRARKFLRRNRPATLATAAVALLVGVLVTFYTVRLADERDRAEKQAALSESVVAFLVETLDEGNPNAAGGDTLTIYDIVDRAETRAGELADQPLVQARVLDAVGRVRLMHGRYERADSLYRAGLALRRQTLGPAHPDLSASFSHLGEVWLLQGRYAEADSVLRRSDRLLGTTEEDDLQRAEVLKLLGSSLMRQSNLQAADSLFQAALSVYKQHLEPGDRRVVDTYLDHGRTRLMSGDYDAAEASFQTALDGFTTLFPEGHTSSAAALTNLATIARVRGRYGTADSLYTEGLAMMRDLVGDVHPSVAGILNNMGASAYRQGQFDRAVQLFRETLQVRTALLGDTNPEVASAHNNLAVVLSMLERFEDAEAHYRSAQRIRSTVLGPNHPHTITTLNNIGGLHEERGDLETAENIRRDVLKRYRAALGPDHPRVALALNNLGALLHKRGATREAESTLTAALDLRRRILAPTHDGIARVLENLGSLYEDEARWEDAEAVYREALTIRRTATPEHVQTALAARDLGRALTEQDRYAEAEPFLLRGYADLRDRHGPDHAATQTARAYLSTLYTAWNRPHRADAVQDSLAAAEASPAPTGTTR